jgi:hypothetical protein
MLCISHFLEKWFQKYSKAQSIPKKAIFREFKTENAIFGDECGLFNVKINKLFNPFRKILYGYCIHERRKDSIWIQIFHPINF